MSMSISPHEFIYDLPDDQAQPIRVQAQSEEFIAVVQWDGAGEDLHWVLVPKKDVQAFVDSVLKAAAE
jgi:hypothetical protein